MLHAVLQGAFSSILLRIILPAPKLLLHVQLPQRSCRSQRRWHCSETVTGQVQLREVPQPCSVPMRLSEAPQAITIQSQPLYTMHTSHLTLASKAPTRRRLRLCFLQMPLTWLEPG